VLLLTEDGGLPGEGSGVAVLGEGPGGADPVPHTFQRRGLYLELQHWPVLGAPQVSLPRQLLCGFRDNDSHRLL